MNAAGPSGRMRFHDAASMGCPSRTPPDIVILMVVPRILSVSTEEPEHVFDQDDALTTVREWLRQTTEDPPFPPEKTERVFRRAGVSRRHSIMPLRDLLEPRDFGEKTGLYRDAAGPLARRVVNGVLNRTPVDAPDVDYFVSVSCTGFTIPALDADLLNEMAFRPDVRRLPIAELGCGAGASGLGRAFEYLEGHPADAALVLAVELCTLNIHPEDPSRVQIVSGAMFGDGSAGAVLAGPRHEAPSEGFDVLGYDTHFFEDTTSYMGYENSAGGMKIMLSPKIPAHVKRYAPGVIESFLDRHDLTPPDVDHWLVHPGGRAILDVLEEVYPSADLSASRRVLDRFGNMSSATVLYVLRDVMRKSPAPGDRALMMAFGPGFYADLLLLRWADR